MIILDTNVISEVMEPAPDPKVRAWLNEQLAQVLFVTSISLAELHAGVAGLPEGRRKRALADLLAFTLETLFGERILAFDHRAAERYAEVARDVAAEGVALSFADGQIATIAKVHRFAVVTRDTRPFEAAGLDAINPWEGPT